MQHIARRLMSSKAGTRVLKANITSTVRSSYNSAMSEEQEGKHIPYGQEGTGFYSLATKGCFDVINNSKPLVMESLERAVDAYKQRNDGKPFIIADYGTADGGTSMPLVTAMLERLQTLIGSDPVIVLYEDQTNNDFNSVFKRTHGIIPTPTSYKDETPLEPFVKKYENVFVMASGTTFYDQVAPESSVDMGFSATAMHWLTKSPCSIPDALHSACSQDADALALFEEQAYKDLKAILQQRAKELKVGGQFVCINFAKDDEGQFLGHTKNTPVCMHTTFYELWSEMAQEGLLKPEEVMNTNFPNQYRSLDEHRAVFADPDLSALSLDGIFSRVVPCPYRQSLLKGEIAPQDYPATYLPTTRTWSNSTFASGLSSQRSEDEKQALVDEMYHRYAQRVLERPSDHGMDYVHAYVTFSKQE
eukprot:m.62908 g.62908  ORF g.62908 m.62908 type:complete len:418 (-) comp13421_c4_seq1:361-1614(-)